MSSTADRSLTEWLAIPGMAGRLDAVFRRAASGQSISPEDVRQAVFVTAFKAPSPTFASEGALLAWASTAAARKVRDLRRSFHGQRVVLVPVLPEDAADHVEAVLATFTAKALRLAVAALPRVQREAIHAVYYDRLTLADAAARLGIPVSTLQRHLARALDRLRELLEADGYGRHVALPALMLGGRLRRPPVVAACAVAVALHTAAGWTTLPHRTNVPDTAKTASTAVRELHDGSPRPGGPAGPVILRRRAAAPPAAAGDTGPAHPRRDVALRVSTGVTGEVCAGTTKPKQCNGDALTYQTPQAVRRITGDATDPVDGTTVTSQQVPLCEVPNTPATRCEPHAPPAEEEPL